MSKKVTAALIFLIFSVLGKGEKGRECMLVT